MSISPTRHFSALSFCHACSINLLCHQHWLASWQCCLSCYTFYRCASWWMGAGYWRVTLEYAVKYSTATKQPEQGQLGRCNASHSEDKVVYNQSKLPACRHQCYHATGHALHAAVFKTSPILTTSQASQVLRWGKCNQRQQVWHP